MATASFAFWLTHIIHKVFNSIFFSFHGMIVNYPNNLVLTSALQVMHIHVRVQYKFHIESFASF